MIHTKRQTLAQVIVCLGCCCGRTDKGKGPAGSKPIILPGHETRVSSVAFQRRGSLLASGGDEGRIVLWEPGSPKPLRGATLLP